MLFSINPNDPRPVYLQLAIAVKEAVRLGQLRPGDSLPSVRELAQALSINLHTARHAYQLLGEEGVIVLRLGSLARVAQVKIRPDMQEKTVERMRELVADAFLNGMSPEQLRKTLEEILKATTEIKGK